MCVVEVHINICWAKEPVNHTLHCWPISREGEGKVDLRVSVAEETHTHRVESAGERGGGERETDEENDREEESQRGGRVAVTELPCPACK